MKINMEKIEVMKISRQLFPLEIAIEKKTTKECEYFKYFGSMITNDARCTSEIESRITMTLNK